MTIELLVAVLNDGIKRVENLLLAPQSGVSYFIAWQHTDGLHYNLPESITNRHDVMLLASHIEGLSKNRNATIEHASGDILIVADDDCTYTADNLERIRQYFIGHSDTDICLFQAVNEKGDYLKPYPDKPFNLQKRPRGYYVSSVEIVMRRSERLPLFDERFGLGATFLCNGEEEIFIYDALKARLQVEYEPMQIVQTHNLTTGKRFLESAAVRRSKGAVLCYLHGPIIAFFKCLKENLHLKGVGFFKRLSFLRDTLRGIKYISHGRKC